MSKPTSILCIRTLAKWWTVESLRKIHVWKFPYGEIVLIKESNEHANRRRKKIFYRFRKIIFHFENVRGILAKCVMFIVYSVQDAMRCIYRFCQINVLAQKRRPGAVRYFDWNAALQYWLNLLLVIFVIRMSNVWIVNYLHLLPQGMNNEHCWNVILTMYTYFTFVRTILWNRKHFSESIGEEEFNYIGFESKCIG